MSSKSKFLNISSKIWTLVFIFWNFLRPLKLFKLITNQTITNFRNKPFQEVFFFMINVFHEQVWLNFWKRQRIKILRLPLSIFLKIYRFKGQTFTGATKSIPTWQFCQFLPLKEKLQTSLAPVRLSSEYWVTGNFCCKLHAIILTSISKYLHSVLIYDLARKWKYNSSRDTN